MSETLDDLLEFAGDEGYLDAEIHDGMVYAIMPLLFTFAIIKFKDKVNVDDRWCYSSYEDAVAALREWKGRGFAGEPDGWHRHPYSGRRRDGQREWVDP